MTDNDIPKHEKELYLVMNEDGEMDSGPTLMQAAMRLNHHYAGNMLRAVKMNVHMAAPVAEDCGDVIIPDADGSTVRLTVVKD
jgi:hypothetical protein